MNKRLVELSIAARKEVWGNNQFNGAPEFEGYELDEKEFARLIILECANVAMDSSVSDEASDNDWHADRILLTIGGNIKKHFGFEE